MHLSIIKTDNFFKYCKEIIAVSDEIIDGWKLFNNGTNPYIMKSSHIKKDSELFLVDYHIIFSISYGVPVLCFNVFHDDGSIVDNKDAWELFKFNRTDHLETSLTQTEHPTLKIPFLTLHPCETDQLIGTCFLGSKNPLVSWLSAIGPTVGLDLPLAYEKLTHKP